MPQFLAVLRQFCVCAIPIFPGLGFREAVSHRSFEILSRNTLIYQHLKVSLSRKTIPSFLPPSSITEY